MNIIKHVILFMVNYETIYYHKLMLKDILYFESH